MPGKIFVHNMKPKRKRPPRGNRPPPLDQEPLRERFRTYDEVKAYLAQDPIPCLICAKKFTKLGAHIAASHDMTVRDYKLRFGIPVSMSIACEAYRERLRASVARENLVSFTPGSAHFFGSSKGIPRAPCSRLQMSLNHPRRKNGQA